jgi:hypothetical protein
LYWKKFNQVLRIAIFSRPDAKRNARGGAIFAAQCAAIGTWQPHAQNALWNERINQPPKHDLLSMMAHSDATRNMDERNFLGNLILLIIGGNDTTRNSLSARSMR